MTATGRTARRKPPAKKLSPKPSKELAVIPKTQLELDFERILTEMHAGFDRVQAETDANLDKMETTFDFGMVRADIDTQFDIIEQAGEKELQRLRQQHDDPGRAVLEASVDFAAKQEELADTAQCLADATYRVRLLAADAARLVAATSAMP